MTNSGVTPGRPAAGTGEVVVGRTESPTADVWTAFWNDEQGHIVDGPVDAPLDECLAWAWSEGITPSEIRIKTSNPSEGQEPAVVLTQTVEYDSRVRLPDGRKLGPGGHPM